MAEPFTADANDYVYRWDASRDHNQGPKRDCIRAAVLAINSADDERNPPETGMTEAALRKVANARLLLIPASAETTGHGTTGNARWCARGLGEWRAGVPRRGS